MFRHDTPCSALRPKPAAPQYVTRLEQVPDLPADERERLQAVADVYPFRANDYYLGLIDWKDPNDPIRRIIVPCEEELSGWGNLDASNESSNTIGRGIQHKYPDTVILLCNETCGGFCRYCFRKRLFTRHGQETNPDITAGLRYIASRPQVTNVLLTGGDPLLLNTHRLATILKALREIQHVRVIRLGSKMPAFNPWRVLDDDVLQTVLSNYSTAHKRIYLMTHFDHPRELTNAAVEGVDRLIRCGVICANQCPLVRGVNDDPAVLSDLFRTLSWIGCPPYYLFQGRPTAGNEPYSVPIVRGWRIFREAMRYGSGLARRARFVMSHSTGKIEILGIDSQRIYVRYQRAKDAKLRGRFLVYKRNDDACWLDDLQLEDDSDNLSLAGVGPEARRPRWQR